LERRKMCTRFWWESQKERDLSEDRGVDGRMGSEWILGRLDSVGSLYGLVADSGEHGDEPSGSTAKESVKPLRLVEKLTNEKKCIEVKLRCSKSRRL
jgi:hypothetical protein